MSTFKELEEKAKDCTTIAKLFELWKQAQKIDPNYENNSHQKVPQGAFHADGIVDLDETYYNNASPKVLFLLKEPNVLVDEYLPDENSSAVSWVRERYKPDDDSPIKKHRMCTAIANIYARVFRQKEIEVGDSLKQIAFMNLNKRGSASVAEKHLFSYLKYYKEFIKKEIILLNPDYVVVGGEGLLKEIKSVLYPHIIAEVENAESSSLDYKIDSSHSFIDVK